MINVLSQSADWNGYECAARRARSKGSSCDGPLTMVSGRNKKKLQAIVAAALMQLHGTADGQAKFATAATLDRDYWKMRRGQHRG